MALLPMGLLSGCSGSNVYQDIGSNFDESSELREYAPPDSEPPTASILNHSLPRASGTWRVDGILERYVPASDADVPITETAVNGEFLEITISSSASPMDLRFRSFVDLKAGVPVSDIPTIELNCLEVGRACSVNTTNGQLVVRIPAVELDPGVHVLEAIYPTQEPLDVAQKVNHYAISWAIRTR